MAHPYSDPALRQRSNWEEFVQALSARNMVDFSLHAGRERVEFFFVPKKDQRLRMVCDCRHSNCWFDDPDPVALCTGETLSRLEVPKGSQLYILEADLSDAFHHLELPPGLRDIFSMRPVRAAAAGLTELDGRQLAPGDLVVPGVGSAPWDGRGPYGGAEISMSGSVSVPALSLGCV